LNYLFFHIPFWYGRCIIVSLTYIQTTSGGPREPWHDLHCKIDGPAAYDVLTNFEQRFNKAMKWLKLRKVKQGSDTLLKLDRIAAIRMPSAGPDGDLAVRVTNEQDPESWNVQVLDIFLIL